MTASTGVRPRVSLPFIDDRPRTFSAWAAHLKIAKETLRGQIDRRGSLAEAVRDFTTGENLPWSKRHPNGCCRKGHKIEGDNIIIRIEAGIERQRCRLCYWKPPRVKKIKVVKPPRFESHVLEFIDSTPRTMTAWARHVGVDKLTMGKALRRGVPLADAVKGFMSGELLRYTKANPVGRRRKGPRKHVCVVPSVDPVARGVQEWAQYLGIKFTTLQKRLQRRSLEEAVLFTINNAWHTRNTGNRCRKGHEFTPQNTRQVRNSRTGLLVRQCVTCTRERVREYQRIEKEARKIEREKRRAPALCRKGIHKLEGANVYYNESQGRTYPMCRACRNAYQTLRNEKRRMGLSTANPTTGLSLDAKIAYFSRRNRYGCRIWSGSWNGSDPQARRPKVYISLNSKNVGVQVRTYIWQKKTGTTLPKYHAVMSTCNDNRCIEAAHLYIVPLKERTHSEEARQAAARRWRLRGNTQTNDYARAAMAHLPAIVYYLQRFRAVAHEAEDIAQDAVMRTYMRMAQTGSEVPNLKAYLLTAAKNLALAQMTKNGTRGYHVSLDNEDENESSEILGLKTQSLLAEDPARLLQDVQERQIERNRYKARINRMTRRQKQFYLLRARGIDAKDIARQMGIQLHTVERVLGKAFKVMRGRHNSKGFEVMTEPGALARGAV